MSHSTAVIPVSVLPNPLDVGLGTYPNNSYPQYAVSFVIGSFGAVETSVPLITGSASSRQATGSLTLSPATVGASGLLWLYPEYTTPDFLGTLDLLIYANMVNSNDTDNMSALATVTGITGGSVGTSIGQSDWAVQSHLGTDLSLGASGPVSAAGGTYFTQMSIILNFGGVTG
jgi:hypothetical protein